MASGFWDLVIDRITRTLDGWKKTFLSLGNNNFNSILLFLYPLLFFITFQDSSISGFKDCEIAKGFFAVADGRL